jgi:hypothetical protein
MCFISVEKRLLRVLGLFDSLDSLTQYVTVLGVKRESDRGPKIADNSAVSRRECIFPISLLAFWKLQCIYRRYVYKLLFRSGGKEGGRCQS